MTTTQTTRQDIINRAITLIDNANPHALARYLADTSLHDHIKADPGTLRQHLADATAPDASVGARFSAWKAAQQLLQAAGLPWG